MKLPQFLPILTAFAARIAGQGISELLQSPAALARALADTQTVVGHDGVLCLFEPGLLSLACIGRHGEHAASGETGPPKLRSPAEIAQTPPVASLLETIQALRHLLQSRASVVATLAGPGLLYSQLQAELGKCGSASSVAPSYVVDVIRNVVRSAFELQAEGVALIEIPIPADSPDLLRSHKMVGKLADFYDAPFFVFNLSGAEDGGAVQYAHCVFDLHSARNGLGPVWGKLRSAMSSNVLPLTTVGDVPDTTPVEEIKRVFQPSGSG